MLASQKLIKDKNIITREIINAGTEVSNNYAGLDLNGTLCDYEIICEGKKFSCHKAVLASNSKVFEVFSIYLYLLEWAIKDFWDFDANLLEDIEVRK